MKKFDGILICSDADGTFCGEGTIGPNSEAVKYFTGNGGKFTFATGRAVVHMRGAEYFDIINAPVCLYNGGIIYDYKNEKILRERRLRVDVEGIIRGIYGVKDRIEGFYICNSCGADSCKFSGLDDVPENLYKEKALKIICVFDREEDADYVAEYTRNSELLKDCCILKSWSYGLEFNSADATKGNAIKFIKDYLGDIHTSVGIGDYENDIELLKSADIGVAVGNAIDKVKQVAEMIVKPCREFAIKDLIEILDKKYS